MVKADAQENNPSPVRTWYREAVVETFSAFSTTERGLDMVEVVKRLKQYGPNCLPAAKTLSFFRIFINQFLNPLIYILLIASIVVFFLGEITDAIVIVSVLIINAVIGVIQEGKAQNTLLALENFTKTEAVALRNGVEEVIGDQEIVPGDVIVLREGDKVPADARLFELKNLQIDESALTGESTPVSKNIDVIEKKTDNPADQLNMVFRGSLVVSGAARAVVVATGVSTVIGGISRKMVTINTDIPLNKSIQSLSKFIGVGVLLISASVFGLGILYGNSAGDMFFTAVAVAVSLVPEGLPVVITLVLSIGAYRMAKQNALVKNLGAVEALGQASVIAVDKTGTITKNELMVEGLYIDGKTYEVTGNGYESKGNILLDGAALDPANHPEILFAGKIATFCANARVSFHEKEQLWKVSGDPTEAALLVFGEKAGFHKDELEQEERQVSDLPFTSDTKYHATVHMVNKKSFLSVVGAPENILALSNKIWNGSKTPRKLSDTHKAEIEAAVQTMSSRGLRVVAFSYIPNYKEELGVAPIQNAVFIGFFAMRDVLREGVRESIEIARANGVRVVMITGDHRFTAKAIAREAGIFREGDEIITGKELKTMTKAELVVHLNRVSVFARVTPESKLDIIELLRANGDIVGMTGDGVNDALSLVAADLGIAMGKVGTEVSKEAADIVLLDDNFRSVTLAIEEGRNIYHGIKKVILYLFSTGLGELLTVVIAMVVFLPLPLLPTQILWLNLVTDGFLVAALAFEPKEKLRNRIVKKGNRFFFDRLAILRTLTMGLVMASVTLFVFSIALKTDAAKAYTLSLTVLAAMQWWNAWNVRSEKKSIWSKKMWTNPYLVVATVIVIGLQLFAIYNPIMQKLLNTTALSLTELGAAVMISLSIVFVEELRKLLRIAFHGKK